MTEINLILPIIIPLIGGLIALIIPKELKLIKGIIAIITAFINLFIMFKLFGVEGELSYVIPWGGYGIEFALRLYTFSKFITVAIAAFGFLIILYSLSFMKNKNFIGQFYAYFLITVGFATGAVLADNLILLLFFWEGLLGTLFGMIAIGNKNAYKTAIKAFLIVGITDLCMMLGIALTGYLAGTFTISKIHLQISSSISSLAFILLMIGAISKGGAMPFHTWIPDAAVDAPLPFMAFIPGALEKLLGIYFLTRISIDIYELHPESWLSMVMMIIGAVTILFAVMMALIQKDYKRLLSYHAISQVGYMILGIGTATPVGIIGGLFHMINNALYKSCLFLTGGAVEKQAGSTNLEKLGGLAYKMPITFICYFIAALSISGFPFFNGFFSKELVYDGALERGLIFYLAAVTGSFFTAASFLKLGHAAFLGKLKEENKNVKEASPAMLIPMIILAVICVLFGVYNEYPIDHLIVPILGEHSMEGHHSFSGFPTNNQLVLISVIVLFGALVNHIYGVKMKGEGLKASDHIHYAPVLSSVYDAAEKKYFDPYEQGVNIVTYIGNVIFKCDRAIDWLYDVLVVKITYTFTNMIRKVHDGNVATYLMWIIIAIIFIMIYLLRLA